MKKIVVFITVRLGSSRLPRKALLLIKNKPIISFLVERVKQQFNKDSVFFCTTNNIEDNFFDSLANELGINACHGSSDNILKRHYSCSRILGSDYIINIDGDDILCNTDLIGRMIQIINSEKVDIVYSEGYPFGTNLMAYNTSLLKSILNKYDEKTIDTGWGSLIKDENIFSVYKIKADVDEMIDARMTLDYDEDFIFFRTIIENLFHESTKYISQIEIITYLKNHPEVVLINKHLDDKYWDNFMKKRSIN